MVEIDRKLSQRPITQEGLLDFINRELIPVVEKIRLALATVGVTTGGDVFGPDGATAGHLASFADATGKLLADSGYTAAQLLLRPARAVTASRSSLADDPFYTLEFNSASPIVYTLAAGVTPVGCIQYGYQKGAGSVTFATPTSAETLVLRKVGAGVQIHHVEQDVHRLFGDVNLT